MHLQTQTQQWLDPSRGSIEGGFVEEIQWLPLVEKIPISEGSNERSELVDSLRGQNIDLPDLHKIFEGWPEAINEHVDSLRIVVDADLDKYEPGRADSEACKHLILQQTLASWKATIKAQGVRFWSFLVDVVARCIVGAALHRNLSGHLGRLQRLLTQLRVQANHSYSEAFCLGRW